MLLPIALLLAVFFIFRFQYKKQQQQLQLLKERSSQQSEHIQLLLEGAQGLGMRLRHLESNVAKPITSENSRTSNDEISVRQAIELARKGATVDELIDICGLSQGEAELMCSIHKTA